MKDITYFEEKRKSGEVIFDGRVLHVRRDVITLPNGRESVREYCLHNGASAVVPLTDEGEVIMVRQYRYALGRVTLEIPAGKLDSADEDPLEAAKRELREETGYTAEKITSLGGLYTTPALLTEVIHMYLAEELIAGECDPDEDEFLELVKLPLDEAVDMVLRGEICDSKTQAAILKVYAMKRLGK